MDKNKPQIWKEPPLQNSGLSFSNHLFIAARKRRLLFFSCFTYYLYSGNCLYLSNSASHCSLVVGGRIPLMRCQSVMDSPDSVNLRVKKQCSVFTQWQECLSWRGGGGVLVTWLATHPCPKKHEKGVLSDIGCHQHLYYKNCSDCSVSQWVSQSVSPSA